MKVSKTQKAAATIRFNATVSQLRNTKKATSNSFITLPKSANAKLASPDTVMVEGTINALPFRAALVPDDEGSHQLKVSEAMREALRIIEGEVVPVEITRIEDEAEIRVPMDLHKALTATPGALSSWKDITPMARRDWIFSICTSKQPETRKRRIDKACDMLRTGKRRLCCFPGIKWLMEKNAKSCGMWLPLPSLKNLSKKRRK